MKQSTDKIFMVRPAAFGFNHETAISNHFQNLSEEQNIAEKALKEFDNSVAQLINIGVKILVENDTPSPKKPDAIFPNNWVSFHANDGMIIYPMQTQNRRFEKREDLIEKLFVQTHRHKLINLSPFEENHEFLEGTGSIVFDHIQKTAYACLSPRTSLSPLNKVCEFLGYEPITFSAFDEANRAIYHTNVMMMIGTGYAFICSSSIKNKEERLHVIESLRQSGKEIIDISFAQMNSFCGNMLEVETKKGKALCMSETAYNAFTQEQLAALSKLVSIETFAIPSIEKIGGGGIRCMMAEIF